MKKVPIALVIAFLAGCLVTATAFSGCSQPADRTLTIHQLQSTETYPGKFLVDTSELPGNAIESRSDVQVAGERGKPSTQINLNPKYEIEVVLRLADSAGSR